MLTAHSSSLIAQASSTAQTLATVTDHLRSEQDKLGETGLRFATALETIGGRLEQRVMESLNRAETGLQGIDRLSELAAQMGTAIERLNSYSPPAPAVEITAESVPANIWMEIKTGFEITMRSIERLREEFIEASLRQPVASAEPLAVAGPDQSGKIIEQITASNDTLARAIAQQAEQIEGRLAAMDKKIGGSSSGSVSIAGMSPEEAQSQLQQQAQILSELATALGAIDQHMQEMSATFKGPGPKQNGGRMAS